MHKYIDIHSHLNDPRFAADLPDVTARMRAGGVASIVVGTDRTMSERAIALAEQNTDLWATIGLHPTDNHKEAFDDEVYVKMAAHPRVVGIGECGLDYHWPEHDKWSNGMAEEKKRQHELFEAQIAVALKVNKPLMIHGRPSRGTMDAYEDILAILKDHPGIRGNVHFFVGNIDIAKQFLDLGFTMSFTGVLTFTHDYDDVVLYIPSDSIMSETDAPYVAPAPYRGKRNEPLFVRETVASIARIRGVSLERTAEILRENASRSFCL
jgi:TatD DNase family protein